MNAAEFDVQFNRLTAHFHLPTDASRETLGIDWFKALEHHHIDAFDHAITELTRTATDRYWPALGRVTEIIHSRQSRYDRHPGKCATCNGTGWVDVPAFKVGSFVYGNAVDRCPDCGIPAPQVESHSRRQPLTDLEQHEYQARRYGREQMPEGLQGKPWDEEKKAAHKASMKAAFDKLRIKLFGSQDDAA